MKLSDIEGSALPTKLSAIPDAPAGAQEDPSFLSKVAAPVKAIPGAISEEFGKGRGDVRSAVGEMHDSAKKNEIPSTMSSLKYVGGVAQEAMSPFTGFAKAMYGDPIRAAVPGKVGETIGNVAEFAASGGAPGAISKSLSTMSKALPEFNKSVKMLMDAGINLTPGDIAKGIFKKSEDALRSLPVVGDMVAQAQYRSLQDFNKAVYNKALDVVGLKLPKDVEVGPDAVRATEDALSAKYQDLFSQPSFAFKPDMTLIQDIKQTESSIINKLPKEQQKQWLSVIQDMTGRMTPAPTGGKVANGTLYQQFDREARYLGVLYSKSENPDQQRLGQAFLELRGAMSESLERTNPKNAVQLKELNKAWAIFERARGASARRVSSNGVFSPADLLADIKKSAGSKRFASGDGLIQDFARAGNEVLPSTVPDSGTIRRGITAELVTGGMLGGSRLEPHAANAMLLGAATSAPYTKIGQAGVNRLARGLPRGVATANESLMSPYVGGAASISDLESQK